MLTEGDLRELVESAAAAAPGPDELDMNSFSVAPTPRRRRAVRRPVVALGVAAAAIVAVILGAAASRDGDTKQQSFSTVANSIGGGAQAPATTIARTPSVPAPGRVATGASTTAGAGPGTPAPYDYSLVPTAAPPTAGAAPAPGDSANIIKNGALEVRVGRGAVTESVNRLTALATGLGGYIAESRTTANEASGSQASATISVRVPAAAFEQLLAGASKLGDVRSTSTSGQDVTAQFTDIDAQLQALSQTRDQFLLVLGEAKNVGDILAVQDRITQVQTQIDQLNGQKKLLTDQTSYGTLSVTLLEPGATVAAPAVNDDKGLGDACAKRATTSPTASSRSSPRQGRSHWSRCAVASCCSAPGSRTAACASGCCSYSKISCGLAGPR